jgi:hypothetical protein
MKRVAETGMMIFGVVALGFGAFASELRLADGGAPFRAGWRDVPLTNVCPRKLVAEPRYKSDRVLYISIRLGNGADQMITGALAESGLPGSGYDTLYLDANNNGDLTDDPVIRPGISRAGTVTSLDVKPANVTVKYAGGLSRSIRIKLEIRGNKGVNGRNTAWSAACHVDQHLEGRLDIGARKGVLVGIYDSSDCGRESNGCFDDYCVDRFRIDLNGDGQLDSKTEDFPLSKAISVDGKLWQITIGAGATNIDLTPFAAPTGTINLDVRLAKGSRMSGGVAGLISDSGYGFVCQLPMKDGFVLPEAVYRMTNVYFSLVDGTGRKWDSLFSSTKPVAIAHKGSVRVAVGGPFKLGLAYKGELKTGCHVCIMPVLTGAEGEVYENIALVGTRMTPAVKISDAEDVILTEASMDYG